MPLHNSAHSTNTQPATFNMASSKSSISDPCIAPTSAPAVRIPHLAFGLYKIPNDENGKALVLQAIRAGYRHFDCATIYGNEAILGQAIAQCGIARSEFFLTSKVWNDVQRQGRAAVRRSVDDSLRRLGGDSDDGTATTAQPYWDLFYIHWPVPQVFVDTYKELRQMQLEDARKIRNIGLSNFHIADYEELLPHIHADVKVVADGQQAPSSSIPSQPIVNQMEVSPFMYRPETIEYFQTKHGMCVAASKALHRGQGWDDADDNAGDDHGNIVLKLARRHSKTPAQVVLRWGYQKNLIVIAKTATVSRMQENRDILDFELADAEMQSLDALTMQEIIVERNALEIQRKSG